MKIAIASTTKTKEGEISPQGGRAPYYLFFDEKFELEAALKNPFASGGGGAGQAIVKILEDRGVSKVVVGKVGDNMKTALEETNIEFYEREGSILSFLEEIKDEK